MKRMLINATQPEELRVAIAEGQHLFDLDIEVPSQEQKKSNVYKGRITRVEPSLEACFVEFGSSRHGFLPLKEICESSYSKDYRKKDGRLAIRDAVKEGQEIIVQVEKEERGNKGAALTTYISLAGRYLVLMPTNPSAGGVSRRITGSDRDHLREQLQQVTAPDNVGIIIRTAGVGRDADELQWDLDYLLQLWTAIEQAASGKKAPFLIHQESNLFIRALRDHLRNDIGEILVDNETVYNDAREFMQQVMPHNLSKLKRYTDPVPLFSRYQIESQIESAFARTVHLPSGGAVVIDHTEAMLSIDINSARATKGSDIEETAYNTNMESAVEIARQLRLRDLGGLIVIDFIDMTSRKHQREVEECLSKALQIDKARVQIGRISRFGLLEMSRQRLRPSLGESSQETCPVCDGHGTIRSVESLALSILRLIEEEVMKDYTGQIVVQAPNEVVNFLHNEKRAALAEVENRHKVPVMMLANEHMVMPHFEIHRVKTSEISDAPSYKRIDQPEAQLIANERSQANVVSTPAPAVTRPVPQRQAPVRTETKAPGLFSRLANALFSSPKEEEKPKPVTRKTSSSRSGSSRGNQQNRRSNAQSGRQRTQKKTTKKRTSKPNQSNAQQQQRTSKKRTSKKNQSKAQQGRNAQNRNRPARGKQDANKDVKATAAVATAAVATAAVATSAVATSAVATSGGNTHVVKTDVVPTDKDGNVKTEQKQAGNSRGGRRRRSPYKTGGSKPRTERTDTQENKTAVDTQPSATSSTPDQTNVSPGKKTETKQPSATTEKPAKTTPAVEVTTAAAESKPARRKPAAKKAVESPEAKSVTAETKPKARKPRAEKPVAEVSKVEKPKTEKPKVAKPKTTKPKADKPATAKPQASKPKVAKPKAIKANSGPTAEPEKGTKGLYTLKPEPVKKALPAKSDG